MNNQSLNPFGPNASSSSSSLNHQSFNQLLNANMNPNSNRVSTNNPYNNTSNNNNNTTINTNRTNTNTNNTNLLDFQAMLQNFGLLKPNNPIQTQKSNRQNQNQSNTQNNTNNTSNNSSKNLLENVLGQLSNFNANKQNVNALNTNYNNLFNLNNTNNSNTTNNNNKQSNNTNATHNNALHNMLSQLTIPQNVNTMNLNGQNNINPLFNVNNNQSNQSFQNLNQPLNNTNNNTNQNSNSNNYSTNPLFNMSMNNKPITNTSTIGMNLNITSTSHQIPLNINLPQISQQTQQSLINQQPPPLLPDHNTSTNTNNNNNKIKENQKHKQQNDNNNNNNNSKKDNISNNKQELDQQQNEEQNDEELDDDDDDDDEDDSDKSSISSSSSSNVEQFLGNLNSKKRKQRSKLKDNDSSEPAHKRRKFDLNDIDYKLNSDADNKFNIIRDINNKSTKYKQYLSQYNKHISSLFSSNEILIKPYIFIKNDIDILYPHKLCNKLLKYGYDDDESNHLTQSQLLKLYAENIAIMNTYKQYISLPSVIPITLPIIDANKLINVDLNKLLSEPYIIRNWNEGLNIFECKFPLNYTYLDLLLNIGGLTSIKVIDNITNLDIGDEMKLYQYLYLLQNTLPEQREYSMNLISLEISGSVLDTYISRPKFIQNIDWIGPKRHCWFKNNNFRKYFFSTTNNIKGIVDNYEKKNLFYINDGIKINGNENHNDKKINQDELEKVKESFVKSNVTSSGYPEIQKYVLISSANSFTQWHIDFNGSCVWYYMVEGYKYFYIIRDVTYEILDKYREWHIENKQDIWFPEYANCDTQLIILNKNELIILPSGCIHCVYTPVDTIAFSGNFLCDNNIEIQLKIEHLYHQIYSKSTVPCCHYFRDLNALKLIEYYYSLKKLQKSGIRNNKKLKDMSHKLFKNDSIGKQNAIDLCIQVLFWLKEEEEYSGGIEDDRLCKFDIINIYKLKPKIYQCLEMLGIKNKIKIQNEMKKFINKYKHYKQPNKNHNHNHNNHNNTNNKQDDDYDINDDDDDDDDNDADNEEEHDSEIYDDDMDIENDNDNEHDDEEENDNDNDNVMIDESELNPRQRSLRSATKHKNKNKNKNRSRRNKNRNRNKNKNHDKINNNNNNISKKNRNRNKNKNKSKRKHKNKKDWRTNNDKIECFKCKERSPVRHMILFVCCSAYYHLRCAGYTTSRTQRSIQQHIDNGTINKQCPVCVKKGLKSKNT